MGQDEGFLGGRAEGQIPQTMLSKYTLIRLKSQGPLRSKVIVSSNTLSKIMTVMILSSSFPQQNGFQGPRLMDLT